MVLDTVPVGVSFDLFGTLVSVDRPDRPGEAIGAELATRGVDLPGDWPERYAEPHVDVPAGAECPLPEHVRAALASSGVEPAGELVDRAVRAAFDVPVATRDGAVAAVDAAAECGTVGLLSNCSVPGLVEETLRRSAIDAGRFDAVVTSVDCGWRKPDERAFAAVADAMGVPPADLLHVGDDPATDGGADEAGARSVLVEDVPLTDLPRVLPPEDRS